MPKLVVKKKKLGGFAAGGGAGTGKKVTPLRPFGEPKTAPCQVGCPIGNDVRGALTSVGLAETWGRSFEEGVEQAFYVFAKTNPMPATLGRLCIRCCEKECNRQYKDGAVNINQFERFVGDFAIEKGLSLAPLRATPAQGREGKIAVVGAGPAGLSCAYQLARRGWAVTIFEAGSRPGGLLRHVAPFRLPRRVVDAEIRRILDLGVELRTGMVVGRNVSLEELRAQYRAVYVAVGAHGERTTAAAGQESENVFAGAELMRRLDRGERVELGNDVVVIGGGNAALDAARACKRLGAGVTIMYRRTKAEMPAMAYDVDQAEAEGISFDFLAMPIEMVREGARAVRLVCQRLELGEPDARGRRRPVPVRNAAPYERPVSAVIQAMIPEPDFRSSLSRVGAAGATIRWRDGFRTSLAGVFAGGDANKLNLATMAIAQGKRAAEEIDAELTGAQPKPAEAGIVVGKDKLKLDWYKPAERHEHAVLPVAERFAEGALDREVNLGLARDVAVDEAKRCFSCGRCMDCDNCWMYCQDQAVVKLEKTLPAGEHYHYKHELCTGCEKCAEECPCWYIAMR
ncbi:MAG: FAD-dependent oxidoreductase [Deltaproteobacteria bacterium]|nr:FAD-dependent oxidoreductase [Deltaproteobacteria bacterium]